MDIWHKNNDIVVTFGTDEKEQEMKKFLLKHLKGIEYAIKNLHHKEERLRDGYDRVIHGIRDVEEGKER